MYDVVQQVHREHPERFRGCCRIGGLHRHTAGGDETNDCDEDEHDAENRCKLLNRSIHAVRLPVE
jgi:hypothetical protein